MMEERERVSIREKEREREREREREMKDGNRETEKTIKRVCSEEREKEEKIKE